MPLSMLFWMLFIIWILFNGYRYRADYYGLGGHWATGNSDLPAGLGTIWIRGAMSIEQVKAVSLSGED